jgi:putative aminopeptidase FrvX
MDTAFLKAFTEIPSVGTACGPVLNLLKAYFGEDYTSHFVSDGFCYIAKKPGLFGTLTPPRVVFVAHVDEIGGCVYGPRAEGGYNTRHWGNTPDIFADATLQAFDYLAESADTAFPVEGKVVAVGEDLRLALYGDGIRPYRTGWTFQEETTFEGDIIEGKALDPRVTAFAVAEAVKQLDRPDVGAMFVMAEECAMDVAKKAVVFLERLRYHGDDGIRLIVNADVPWINNIGEGQLDLPAIRIYEGRNFIDPAFGIRASEQMEKQGVAHHLSAARSGSQTLLFTPIAPTLSIALPSDGVHLPRVKMSLTGTERCITLLRALGESALDGSLA